MSGLLINHQVGEENGEEPFVVRMEFRMEEEAWGLGKGVFKGAS